MARDTKPATWSFNLRGTVNDKAILQRVVDAHAANGLKISMNQAALILIRRGASPDADTEESARAQIEQHWADCTLGCDRMTIKCPEGWRLRDAWTRAHDHQRLRAWAAQPHPSPGPTPAPTPETAPATAPFWRRFTTTKEAG